MAAISARLDDGSHGGALLAVVVAGAGGAAVYAGLQSTVGGIRAATLPALLRGRVGP